MWVRLPPPAPKGKSVIKHIAICILILWSIISLTTIIVSDIRYSNKTFFGAEVVGPYVQRANGGIECATVKVGDDLICKCHVKADSLLHDKTYLTSEQSEWCDPNLKFPND